MTRKSSAQARAKRMTKAGDSAKDNGDLAGARKSYESALRLVPELPLAMCGLAAVESRERNVAAAEALLKAVIAGSAPSARRAGACVALASGLFSLGRWDEAYDSYANVLTIDVEETYAGERDWLMANAYGGMGAVEDRRDNVVAAAELDSMALRLAPNHAPVLANLAFCYEKMGRLSEAVNTLNQALRLEPERGDWGLYLGYMYRDAGKPHLARECFERAAKLGQTDADEALAELPRDTAEQWYETGREYELGGSADYAAYCFRRALALGDARAGSDLERLGSPPDAGTETQPEEPAGTNGS